MSSLCMLMSLLFVTDPAFLEVTLHPAHMKDNQNNSIPTSLIPFCGYGGNLNITGKYIKDLRFPVCDSFHPVNLDGQRCYALDLNSILIGGKTKPGKANSLFIALDDTTTLRVESQRKTYFKAEGQLRPEVRERGDSPTITISILEGYTNSKPGRYKMTSLKKMVGTDSFLALSDETKGCQIESKEDCKRQRLTVEIQRQCGCLPWIFKEQTLEYVSFPFYHQQKENLFPKVGNICTFNESSCYEPLLKESFGCITSCHGLYADVQFVEEDSRLNTAVDAERFFELANEYKEYRNKLMKNTRFDPTQHSLSKELKANLSTQGALYFTPPGSHPIQHNPLKAPWCYIHQYIFLLFSCPFFPRFCTSSC